MPISIDFLSNTAKFLRGQKDVTAGLEDVGDSLDDLVRDADKAGDKLGDSLVDGAREGEGGVEKLERSFKDLAQTARRESDNAGDAIRKNVKRGTDGASEGLDEFKSESASTAREAAASFGSIEDVADALQETLANAFVGFGPAGAVAGLAVAAGLGLAIAAGQEAAEAINEAKERTGELALELREADGDISKLDLGGKIAEWSVQIADSKEGWEIWQQSATSNLDKARKASKDFEVDFSIMLRALSGLDETARKDALGALRSQLEALNAEMEQNRSENFFAGFSDNAALDLRATALKNQIRELENVTDITGETATANDLLTDALGKNAAAIEEKNEALEQSTDAARNAASAEIDYYASLEESTTKIKENGEATSNQTEAGRANNAILIELAEKTAALAEAQDVNGAATAESNARTAEGRIEFIKAAEAAGYTAEKAHELADAYGLVPRSVSTEAILKNKEKTEAELTALVRDRNAQITVGADTSAADRAITNLVQRQRVATILVRERRDVRGGMGVP